MLHRFVLCTAALAVCLVFSTSNRAEDGRTGKRRVLFDGKSTDGWEHLGAGRFVLEDGALRAEGGMGLLWYTREKLGDCKIRVVYKTTRAQDNSGVFVRVAEPPRDEWYAVHHGFEVQICDATDRYHRTGAVYSMAPADKQPGKVGEWNTLEITLRGELIVAAVNGVEVIRFDPSRDPIPGRRHWYEPLRGPRPTSGYFGLQNHDDESRVYFREITVEPLD